MTDDRTLERAARSWLEEGPTRAPDRAVAAALSRVEATRQDWAPRIPGRAPTSKAAPGLAMAVLVATAAVGSFLYLSSKPSTGPGAAASVIPPPVEPATVAQLNGSWRSVPYVVPTDALAAAEAACRDDPDVPAAAHLVIADARGAEIATDGVIVGTLGFLLPDGDFAHCRVQRFGSRAATAYIDMKGCLMLPQPTAGARCLGEVPAPPLQLVGLIRGPVEFAGKIGQGVAAVRLVYANGLSADATIQGEWFAVYAPNDSLGESYRLLALNASGDVVATFVPGP